jgi:pimeloyl-ACP methyl ester carboxylesterase
MPQHFACASLNPVPRRHRAPLLGLAVAALLTACGGDDAPAPDPLASYKTQNVAWSRCDPAIGGAELADGIAKMGDRLQCAFIRAPMDWSQPQNGDIRIAVMRQPSQNPQLRRGSLLTNPGGPGGDGLGHALSLYLALMSSDPNDPQGALQRQLIDTYDLVGFSPRGTGASTALECTSPKALHWIDNSATPEALSERSLDDTIDNARTTAAACAANPLTPFINTDATARDMDLMRHLLGDEKLHYIGWSYGTWLGAWYASLFPERVGRMVLDSSIDFGINLSENDPIQGRALQQLQDEILLPYAARHPEVFNLGNDPETIRAMALGLPPRLQQALTSTVVPLAYARNATHALLITWLAARELQLLLPQLPERLAAQTPEQAKAALAAATPILEGHRFAPLAGPDAAARDQAHELLTHYYAPAPSAPTTVAPKKSTYYAVRCNDSPVSPDLVLWKANLRELARQAPLYYGDSTPECIVWGGSSVTKPVATPLKQLDLLMVQAQHDFATAAPGALRFFATLDAAHMVYVPGDHQHGLFPYASRYIGNQACVDRVVVNYLLGTSPTERTTTCEAIPLPLDATPTKSSATASSPYTDPEQAERWIAQFKRGIR